MYEQQAKRHHAHSSPEAAGAVLPLSPELMFMHDMLNKNFQRLSSTHDNLIAEIKRDRAADLKRIAETEIRLEDHAKRAKKTEAAVTDVQDLAERTSKALELTIRGIPLSGRESNADLVNLVCKLGGLVEVPFNEFTLLSVFALGVRRQGGGVPNRGPVLMCRFGNHGIRHVFLNRYIARKGFNANEIGFGTDSHITVSENLTKPNAVLRGRATQLKKDKLINNFTVKDGQVKIRVSPQTPYVVVRTMEDVDALVLTGKINSCQINN